MLSPSAQSHTSHTTLSLPSMVYRHISNDLKEVAIQLRNHGRDTDLKISQITGFSTQTLYHAIRHKQATGSVRKSQPIGHGRPQTLPRCDCDYLLQLAQHKPTLFLDEYSWQLMLYCALPVSLSTIHWSLQHVGLNVKHVQRLASKWDPFLCADFIRRIGQYPPHYLISTDEVLKDDRTYTHLWGRAPMGMRVK